MGMGDAMSESAEGAGALQEMRREQWEYHAHPEGEIDEMVDIYAEKYKVERASAEKILKAMTRRDAFPLTDAYKSAADVPADHPSRPYTDLFIHHMCIEELGKLPPSPEDSPVMNGFITFIAFMCFGFLPLLPYLIFYGVDYADKSGSLAICSAATLITLFALGGTQALILKQNIAWQGFCMMFNGGLAAGASYLISWGLKVALGVEHAGEC